MKILVISGPNINLLGIREPDVYGKNTYSDLLDFIRQSAEETGAEVGFFQSNCEGAIVDAIQGALGRFDGIIINPAAYTHTSIAIPDAIKAVALPAVEVHLTDISSREEFRRHSFTTSACVGMVAGKGFEGYREALKLLTSLQK